MATSNRENKFYHRKTYFQRSIKRKRTSKSRNINKEFKSVIKNVKQNILEYTNLQKQQSFYINYADALHNKLPNEIKKCEQYSTVVNRLKNTL